jgi:hypothetical protein
LPSEIVGAADDGRGGDLVRGVVRSAHSGSHALPARLPPAWRTGTFAAALPAPADDRALGDVVEHWLSPALASVMRGDLASLTLLADAGRAAASWRVERPSAFARLRARLVHAASFEVPHGVAPEEGERR